MKEVLTKQFWREVKKTFDEARAETPAKIEDSQEPKPEANQPSSASKQSDPQP